MEILKVKHLLSFTQDNLRLVNSRNHVAPYPIFIVMPQYWNHRIIVKAWRSHTI